MLNRLLSRSLPLAAAFALAAIGFITTPVPQKGQHVKKGHALDAFEYWYTQRAAPYEVIPRGAYLRAAEYLRTSMLREGALTAGPADTTQWESIGPDNVGGRILAVAVHPTTPATIFIGAASGGLWKSTTAGIGASAWTYVNTGYPTIAVSSIAINPLNPDEMYIGTGEVGSAYGRGQVGTPGARTSYGMGVLKSTDGGASWTLTGLLYTFPQVASVQKVLLNPMNPNTVYAVTTEGTFRSHDAGATWTHVHAVLMGMDIVINPADTTTLYAAYGQRNSTVGKGVWKSTNGGTSWTRLTSLDTTDFGRTSLALSPSNPQTVYAGVAHGGTSQSRGLYRTTDGGVSWTLQSSTNYMSSQGWYDNVIAVHPTNPNIVFAAGLDAYKSTNGGSALTKKAFWNLGYDGVVPAGGPEGPANYAHADHHAITFDPVNPAVVYFGTDGGIFATTDLGETYAGRNGGFVTTQFYNGFSNAETTPDVALGGLQDNGTLKYEGTNSWNKTYGGDGGWCAVDPVNADVMYEEYVYLALSKTTNGGASWFGITSGLATGSTNANFIAPFVIAPSSPNILYAGAKVVYKTTNGGSNWFATNGGVLFNGTQVACIGVSSRSADTLIAGTGNSTGGIFQIFASTNGGTSWSNVTGALPTRYPTDISFDPNSSLIAYLTYSGYGTPHVFRTTDAGQTWADISSNLPDVPTQCVTVDPLFPGTVFVGTDLGVFRTLDAGGSWHSFDTGMPPAMILDLAVANPARALRAATFGNGVYERGLPNPPIFDYRTLSIVSPAPGSEVLVNMEITGFSATYRNVGAVTSPDSFAVRFRVLDGPAEVFSADATIASLAEGESRTVVFGGSYTPAAPGTLTLQAIHLAADGNVSNDTLNGSLTVLAPPAIAALRTLKEFCTYEDITGGTPGPSGDDALMSVALPFAFTFDGYAYDSVQMSTNGWLELGEGARGSERGLSATGDIGLGNENGRLFSTARPTKVLGPWFEDLNVDGTGTMSYTTLGSAPARVFAVEWKNVLAYYDAFTTTTRITFQVRLHEGTNLIEYMYGPVQAGTLVGSDLGAMMGVKDHVGGNYHFYDLALGGSGTADQGITDLSPLTDWPGPDSCFILGPELTTVTVGIAESWNLVSTPLLRPSYDVSALFPAANPPTAFAFTGGAYSAVASLAPGRGYWIKSLAATGQSIWGVPLPSANVPVTDGWNLIGSLDHGVAAPSGGIIESPWYAYGVSGYEPVAIIEPGQGYWVKTSASGSILLGGPAPSVAPGPSLFDGAAVVTITDAAGRGQRLYLAAYEGDPPGMRGYDMPPPPPAGAADIRFASQRLIEVFPATGRGDAVFGVRLGNAVRPLRVTLSAGSSAAARVTVEERDAAGVRRTLDLIPGTVVEAGRSPGVTLALRIAGEPGVPEEFTLGQNYPNPFNPVTRIAYALPVESRVAIRVYDIGGRLMRTLLDGIQPAGYLNVEWDGRNGSGGAVGSGVYFYRIEARATQGGQTYTSVRKAALIR